MSRIFTGRTKSIPGGRSVIRSEQTYKGRDPGTARRPVWLEWWVCREVSGKTVGEVRRGRAKLQGYSVPGRGLWICYEALLNKEDQQQGPCPF